MCVCGVGVRAEGVQTTHVIPPHCAAPHRSSLMGRSSLICPLRTGAHRSTTTSRYFLAIASRHLLATASRNLTGSHLLWEIASPPPSSPLTHLTCPPCCQACLLGAGPCDPGVPVTHGPPHLAHTRPPAAAHWAIQGGVRVWGISSLGHAWGQGLCQGQGDVCACCVCACVCV